MRKFLALGALLALSVTLHSPASAQTCIKASKQLQWRHTRAAVVIGSTDSGYVSHTGAITDTTVSFNLDGRGFVPYVLGADSISHFDLALTARSGNSAQAVTASCDSIYVTVQGSFDGLTWDSAPQVGILEGSNGSGLYFFKGYATTRSGINTPAATTNLQLGSFPFLRLIVQTSAVDVGILEAHVYWWKQVMSPQW